MAKGRKPLPDSIKAIQGTLYKKRINNEVPEFQFAVVPQLKPPDRLDEVAKKHWLHYASVFFRAGTLTEADLSYLDLASERWSLYCFASARLRRLVKDGIDPTKYNILAHTAIADYIAIMREFGAGAASRSKIKVEKAAEKDEFADLFDNPEVSKAVN